MDRLHLLVEKLAVVGEVRGRGLMVGVELVRPGGKEPHPEAAGAALEGCRRRGVLIGRGGVHGNVLRISPPLSVTAEEVDQAAGAIMDALMDLTRNPSG